MPLPKKNFFPFSLSDYIISKHEQCINYFLVFSPTATAITATTNADAVHGNGKAGNYSETYLDKNYLLIETRVKEREKKRKEQKLLSKIQ